MTSPFTDLDRPPLRAEALRRALVVPGAEWASLEVVADTPSTNADLVAAAAAGAAHGTVLVGEHQSAGRGRLGRSWAAPPRSALTFSVLLRPPPATRARWGWLPLLAGAAVASAVREATGVDPALKWPNDVLVGERKLAGVLAQVAGEAVVVGIGLNVSLRTEELPVPTATSLALAGASTTDRDTVLRAVLRRLGRDYRSWREHDGEADTCGLRPTYLSLCTTLGRDVTVHLPDGESLTGRALDVDAEGRLVVETGSGARSFAAGDVVHVRPDR